MPDYPYPKPYRQEPNGPWIVRTGRGVRTFTDTELAWSAYYFAKLQHERDNGHDQAG
jgi:hypothetical protein